MSHRKDLIERIRRTVIPPLGVVTQFIEDLTGANVYVERQTDRTEFVGAVEMSEEKFEQELHDMGFERNPLASLKHLYNNTQEHEEGSFRWVPQEDSNFNTDYQLHAILFDGSTVPNGKTGRTYVFAHWEYRWDRYPLKHYRGVGLSDEVGVDMMRTFLHRNNISFDPNELP